MRSPGNHGIWRTWAAEVWYNWPPEIGGFGTKITLAITQSRKDF